MDCARSRFRCVKLLSSDAVRVCIDAGFSLVPSQVLDVLGLLNYEHLRVVNQLGCLGSMP
uniref:Uncharacterized protein n=1 Tax=Arundo donax TaxID=35708 RepID=A0A0A9EDG8_ARUDO